MVGELFLKADTHGIYDVIFFTCLFSSTLLFPRRDAKNSSKLTMSESCKSASFYWNVWVIEAE